MLTDEILIGLKLLAVESSGSLSGSHFGTRSHLQSTAPQPLALSHPTVLAETYHKESEQDGPIELATRRRFRQTTDGKEGVDRTSTSPLEGLTEHPH